MYRNPVDCSLQPCTKNQRIAPYSRVQKSSGLLLTAVYRNPADCSLQPCTKLWWIAPYNRVQKSGGLLLTAMYKKSSGLLLTAVYRNLADCSLQPCTKFWQILIWWLVRQHDVTLGIETMSSIRQQISGIYLAVRLFNHQSGIFSGRGV